MNTKYRIEWKNQFGQQMAEQCSTIEAARGKAKKVLAAEPWNREGVTIAERTEGKWEEVERVRCRR